MKTMDIYAQRGHKVRFAYPENGRNYDMDQAELYLVLGEEYAVESTSVGQSLTHVYLQEFPGIAFNSVQFEDV